MPKKWFMYIHGTSDACAKRDWGGSREKTKPKLRFWSPTLKTKTEQEDTAGSIPVAFFSRMAARTTVP